MAEINSNRSNTVVGYFPSEQNAEAALQALHAAGFTGDQIGVAYRSESGISVKKREPGFWHRTRALFGGGSNPQDTRTGTAQPLSTGEEANVETTGHYDLDAGDFRRTLTGLSLPDERSRYFSDRFGSDREGVLVTVDAASRRSDAETILRVNGADLGENAELGQNTAYTSVGERTGTGRETGTGPVTENQRMQLYGEVLRVHRDRVQRGEVRLRKETVTDTTNLNVPVSHDELVLERTPVTEERAAPGAQIGDNQEVRIPLSEERVSVEKEPVVREEVEVGKRDVTDVESREEQLRHEELKVENDQRQKEEERRRRAA